MQRRGLVEVRKGEVSERIWRQGEDGSRRGEDRRAGHEERNRSCQWQELTPNVLLTSTLAPCWRSMSMI
eukprot:767575-Hanusia_phi.AAC.4